MPSLLTAGRLPARRGNLLVGCLAVLGVLLLAAIILGVVVWMNWRSWTASAMNASLKAAVQEASLSDEQVRRIHTQIDQLSGSFKAGDVTVEELFEVVKAVEGHPLLAIGLLEYIEYNSLKAQGISDEERAQGVRATERLQRAVVEHGLTLQDLEPVLEPISQRDADGDLQPLQNPTAPQVRLYIQAASSKADELGVADEPYEVDVAEQFESLINDTLGRQVVDAPPAPGLAQQGAAPGSPQGQPDQGQGPSEPTQPAEPAEPADPGEPADPADPGQVPDPQPGPAGGG